MFLGLPQVPPYDCLGIRLIIVFIIHSKYFPVSDWLKPHTQFTIRHSHMSHNPFRVGGQPVEEMYGIMTKISSVSSQNQLLMLKNAPEFTKIMIGEICTSL